MKKTSRAAIIISGILLFFAFSAPLMARIFNIGNALGMLYSAVQITVGAFANKLRVLVDKIKAAKHGKGLLYTAFAGCGAVALCFCAALCSTIIASTTNANGQSTVIVLGCGVHGNVPSQMLSQRINAAYKYLLENPNSVAVLSGGQGPGENISEAQCMLDVLVEKGIDPKRLYMEDKSTNTFENISFSKAIIDENKLSNDIAIVSSGFHLKRAVMIAKKQGITAKRISSGTSLWLAPTYYVRDTLGVIKEFLF